MHADIAHFLFDVDFIKNLQKTGAILPFCFPRFFLILFACVRCSGLQAAASEFAGNK
jgi:hypothetical protein